MKHKLINFRIPEQLLRKFKAQTAMEGVSMTQKILEFIESYVDESDRKGS